MCNRVPDTFSLFQDETPLKHLDRLRLGRRAEATLTLHIHSGTNTCNGCEPGLVGEAAPPGEGVEVSAAARKMSIERQRRQEEQILKKNMLGGSKTTGMVSALQIVTTIPPQRPKNRAVDYFDTSMEPQPHYRDRAAERRRAQGQLSRFDIPPPPPAMAPGAVASMANIGPWRPADGPPPFTPPLALGPVTGADFRPPYPKEVSVHEPIASTSKGFKMLQRLGWEHGDRLGSTNKERGLLEPIAPKMRGEREGLGSEKAAPGPFSRVLNQKERNAAITKKRFNQAPVGFI